MILLKKWEGSKDKVFIERIKDFGSNYGYHFQYRSVEVYKYTKFSSNYCQINEHLIGDDDYKFVQQLKTVKTIEFVNITKTIN